MKERKQRNINNILFHTPHEYFEIKGFTYTEIKEFDGRKLKKEKKQCKKEL